MLVSRQVQPGVVGHEVYLSTSELIVMADFVQEINEVLETSNDSAGQNKTSAAFYEEINTLVNLLTASTKILAKISAGIESLKDAEKSLFEDVALLPKQE